MRAWEEKLSKEKIIERLMTELQELDKSIKDMMEQVNDSNNTLKKIALHPNSLTMVGYIDWMIQSEKIEKKDGFQNRISVLLAYCKKANIHKDLSKFQGFESWAGRRATQSTTRKDATKQREPWFT